MRRSVAALLLLTLVATAGCRRKPTPEAVEPSPTPEPIVSLALPLASPAIGVTLTSLPEPLVASYADEEVIGVIDTELPGFSCTIERYPPGMPDDADRFFAERRQAAPRFSGGEQFETGTVDDARWGRALWSATRYSLDGESLVNVLLVSPHPSGSGALELHAVWPRGSGEVAIRVGQLADLLARLEPAAAG